MPIPSIVGTPALTHYTDPLSMAIGTDANLMLGGWNNYNATDTTFSATYGGETMTQGVRTTRVVDPGFEADAALFYRENPLTGTRNFDPDNTSGNVAQKVGFSVKDVNLTGGPLRATAHQKTGSTTTVSIQIAGGHADDLAVAVITWANGSGGETVSGDDVVAQYVEDGRGVALLAKPSAPNVTLTATLSSAAMQWNVAASVRGNASSTQPPRSMHQYRLRRA